jgi:hypothetical protein
VDDDIKGATATTQALMFTLAARDTDAHTLLLAPLVVGSMAARARGFTEDDFADFARRVFQAVSRQTPEPSIPSA